MKEPAHGVYDRAAMLDEFCDLLNIMDASDIDNRELAALIVIIRPIAARVEAQAATQTPRRGLRIV